MVWLLIGYMFLFIERPFEIWPALGEMRIELLYVLGVLVIAAAWPRKRWLPNRLHGALAGFAAAVVISWILSPWSEKTWPALYDYLKLLVFYLLAVTVVSDERDLRTLASGFIGVMALYMAHSLLEFANGRHVFRMGIVRLVGIDETMNDPNTFAASILYALPIAGAFWKVDRRFARRLFLASYFVLSIVCIILTGSRSAFVGLVALGAFTVLLSRWRWSLVVAAPFGMVVLWYIMPADLRTRFETIVDPDVGPASAATSARGRIQGFFTGLDLWNQEPLSGCGIGAWRMATESEIESHNLYGQLLGETGTLGALTFLFLLFAFASNVRSIRARSGSTRDFVPALAVGIGQSILLLLVEGNFSHNLFRYNWAWFAAFLVIGRYCTDQQFWRRQAVRLSIGRAQWAHRCVPAAGSAILGARV